jgi:hypothetical protein
LLVSDALTAKFALPETVSLAVAPVSVITPNVLRTPTIVSEAFAVSIILAAIAKILDSLSDTCAVSLIKVTYVGNAEESSSFAFAVSIIERSYLLCPRIV